MDYELAKQLKDAGFPQMNGLLNISKENTTSTSPDISIPDAVYYPTLEELINAFGDEPLLLGRMEQNGKWAAGICPNKDAIFGYWVLGDAIAPKGKLVWGCDSPEQACVLLWLEAYGNRGDASA